MMYLGWFIIYIISTPIWNIVIILYSVWHFDSFDWGKTRELSETVQENTKEQENKVDEVKITVPEQVMIINDDTEKESFYQMDSTLSNSSGDASGNLSDLKGSRENLYQR